MAYSKHWDGFWPDFKANLEKRSPEERDQFVQRQKDEIIRLTGTSKKEECLRVFKKIEEHKDFDLELVYSAIQYAQRLVDDYDEPDKKWREDVSKIQKWYKKINRSADRWLRGFSRKPRKEEFNKKPDEFDSNKAYLEAYFQHMSEIDETAHFSRPWRWRPGMEIPKGAPPKKAQNWLNKLLIDHFRSRGITIKESAKLSQNILATFLKINLDLESVKKAYYRSR